MKGRYNVLFSLRGQFRPFHHGLSYHEQEGIPDVHRLQRGKSPPGNSQSRGTSSDRACEVADEWTAKQRLA
jgi:hypothetical protein